MVPTTLMHSIVRYIAPILLSYIVVLVYSPCSVAQVKNIHEIKWQQLVRVLQTVHQQRSVVPFYEYIGSDGKCGFRVRAQLAEVSQQLSALERAQIDPLLRPFTLQYTIERGKFRIHYDTVGTNAPAILDRTNSRVLNSYHAYAESVAAVFNFVWSMEIDEYGFESPLQPDQKYDIFIVEYNGTIYGETFFGNQLTHSTPIRYETYIQVDNDFREYRTKGMQGLRVTAAHEFHHAIQLGSYGYWSDDELYAYELTATWMESVVYPSIKDYYQYLTKYFLNFGGRSLNETTFDGYERVVWALFLTKLYGREIMPRIWAVMRQTPFLLSTHTVLQQHYGTSLEEAFTTFSFWNFYTGHRADTVRYYTNGNEYPLFQPSVTTMMIDGNAKATLRASPLSTTMVRFYSERDTIITMVANIDIISAVQRTGTLDSFEVQISKRSFSKPCYQLNNTYYSLFTTSYERNWNHFFFINNTYTPTQSIPSRDYLAPQPLILSQPYPLSIPLGAIFSGSARIAFYTVSGLLRYVNEYSIITRYGKGYVFIPIYHLREVLSSGIYIVIVTVQGIEQHWKLAVVQ
ncbi:MAG: hypothetical protein N3A63_01365 [Bacteroidetes bacterium]|nr:hypothetical protein [Bacteroidota bacterium]